MSLDNGSPDREIDFRLLAGLAAGLLVLVAVSAAVVWWISTLMLDTRRSADPPPPLLSEARMPYRPPEPRLQADPITDLDTLRAAEDLELTTYGWVDQSGELARIPIDRAIDLWLETPEPGSMIAIPGPAPEE